MAISLEKELSSFKTDLTEKRKAVAAHVYPTDIRMLLSKQVYNNYTQLVADLTTRSDTIGVWSSYKPQTQQRKIAAVNSFFDSLKKQGKITETPHITPIKIQKNPPSTLSYFEFEKIMKVIPSGTYTGSRDRAFFYLMAHAGLKLNEAINLTHSCLKEERKKLQVEVQKKYRIRTLELDEDTTRELINYIQHKEKRDKDSSLSEKLLFVSKKGDAPLCLRQPRRRFKSWTEKAEVQAELHHLRNTYIKALVDSGTGQEKLVELLGISRTRALALLTLF